MKDLATIVIENNAAADYGILPNERAIRIARLDRALRVNPGARETQPRGHAHAVDCYTRKALARRIALLAPLVGLDATNPEDRKVLAAFVTLVDSNPTFFARS